MTESELMDAMRAKYDGFCFDEDASTHVYAPWSVLSFLKEPERGLQSFWYDSAGQASMVLNYLDGHTIASPEFFARPLNIPLQELKNTNSLKTLMPEVFLFQSGYLSIKKRSGNDVILGYPNKEVEESMASVYVYQMVGRKSFTTIGVPDIKEFLVKGNPDEAITAFNIIFSNISYERYPVTSEAACRLVIQILLMGAGMYSDLEKQNSFGRSDLEFDIGDFHWVLEFKYAPEGKNADELLGKALEQMKCRHYGEGAAFAKRKTLLRVGLVFDGKERQFTRYAAL